MEFSPYQRHKAGETLNPHTPVCHCALAGHERRSVSVAVGVGVALAAMASGWGVTGKKGRCYDVWMDFSDCMSHCTMPAECTSRRDDYFECLHHRKEYSRMNAINKEKERRAFGDQNEKPHDNSGHH